MVIDADRPQCSTDADCVARGPDFEGAVCVASECRIRTRWSCLDEPPAPPVTSSTSHTVTFLVRDTVSQDPKVGVVARACRRLDVQCSAGISGTAMTDATGHVSLVVPGGFEGYARFDDPAIAPTLYFFDPPVQADEPGLGVSVNAPETAALLAALTGAEPDASLGVALVTTYDCFEKPADGVRTGSADIGSGAKGFYVRNGLPSTTATDTDETGYAGFVNTPPGTATFSAAVDGKTIGSVTVLVQPGAQTVARIVPHGS